MNRLEYIVICDAMPQATHPENPPTRTAESENAQSAKSAPVARGADVGGPPTTGADVALAVRVGGFSGRVAWGPQNGTFREVPGAVFLDLFLGFAGRGSIREIAQQRLQLFVLPRPERPLLFPGHTFLKNWLPNDGSQF